MKKLATLTAKAQITIPSAVRKALGLQPGDRLVISVEGDHVILRPLRGSYAESLEGLGKDVWEREGGADRYLERERASWPE